MKGLFSISTEEFFDYFYHIDAKNITEIDQIYSKVTEQLKLCISNEHIKILMNPDTPIDVFADCCIDICMEYFICPSFSNPSNGLSPWVQLYEEFSDQKMDENSLKKEETVFRKDVKSFLLYSFLYRRAYQKKPIIFKNLDNSPFFTKTFAVKDKKSLSMNSFSTTLSRLNNRSKNKASKENTHRVFNYRSNSDTTYLPKYYLDFLINYKNTPGRICHGIYSYYDIHLFLGLIQNMDSINNPYLLPTIENKKSAYICHLEEFLSNFSKFMPTTSGDKIDQFSASLNNYFDKIIPKASFLTEKADYFIDMHSILTEKVTHINLINQIYLDQVDLLEKHQLDDALYDLAGYPLLRHRIYLIDKFKGLIRDDKLMTYTSKSLSKISSKIFCHQIFYTFPILDIVFHTFLLKYGVFQSTTKLKNIHDLINTSNTFFRYEKPASDGPFIMAPNLPPNTLKFEKNSPDLIKYSTIADNVYNTFGTFLSHGIELPIITIKESSNETHKSIADSLFPTVEQNCYPKIQKVLRHEFNKELGNLDPLKKKPIPLQMDCPFYITATPQE